MYLLRREPGPEDYIFCSRSGRPLNADDLRKRVLYPAMDKARVKRSVSRGFGFHIFRHTADTRLLEQTGDIHRVSGFLGHASTRITEQVYTHRNPHAAEDARVLEAVFHDVPQESTQRAGKPN